MSSKEALRPGLVRAALEGKITNQQGATALGLTIRQFRRLKAAYRRAGVTSLLHGNRGRPSPKRWTEPRRAQVLELMHQRYAGLNDCHLTEKLREVEALELSREMVRRLRISEGIAPVRRRRAPRHRIRRLREAREGAMVLIDGSDFAWLGLTQPPLTLVGAVDDASGKILVLHFRPHEDLQGYTELLRRLICQHGVPTTLYGDRLSVFVRNDSHWSIEEQLAGERRPTQYGAMLAELGIGFIAAQSPQAKGRIERLWQTLQDRLVKELRLRNLTSVAEAEHFLPEFIADYNRRFAQPARESGAAWRRAPGHLDRMLSCRYLRLVARDNTVTLPGRWLQLPPGPGRRSWHRSRVEIRELLDGRLLVLHPKHGVIGEQAALPNFTLAPRQSVARRVALGIDAPGSTRSLDRKPSRPKSHSGPVRLGQLTNIRRPKPNHRWKKSYNPDLQPSQAGAGGT